MKYFKLGLLAATLSLVALVIALDKKENKCDCEGETSCDNSQEEENNIIVEEDIVVETVVEE